MDQNKKGKPPDVSVLWDDRPEWSTVVILVLFMVALLIWASVEMTQLKQENERLKFSLELQKQTSVITKEKLNYAR